MIVEETLERELREVADGLQIPALPPLPQETPRAQRHWLPLLVAAAVVLVVVSAVAVLLTARGGQEPASPSPSPSPSRTEPAARIPTTAPTVPYVLDQRLYVDGEQVSGAWSSVRSGDAGWLALRTDNTWWSGRGPQSEEIPWPLNVPPVISLNGAYVAMLITEAGVETLTGFDTSFSGEGLGGIPIDLGDRQDGSAVSIRAVTNDGRVIAQGTNTSLLWLPRTGDGTGTVDLTVTAPGQLILGNSPAGLIVSDGEGGEPYLAEISDAGELTRVGAIPAHDDIAVSPGAEWMAWTAPGTTGGEVTSIPTLEAQTVDGTQQATLTAPAGWGFRVRGWVWEDDDHLVSPVVGDAGERMMRCSVRPARCVLIKTR